MDVDDVAFGRRPAPDARDRTFPMRLLVPEAIPVPPITFYYPTGPVLDQGRTGTCVGHAWRQWLSSALLMTKGGPDAFAIYDAATQIDEWTDNDADTGRQMGTSVRAAAKVLQQLGHIGTYVWASSAAEVRDYLLAHKGTMVMGTDWHHSMMNPDAKGFLSLDGDIIGGHAYVINGWSTARNAFRMVNSWNRTWGQVGRAWIRFGDLDALIHAEGEACGATELKMFVRLP